MGFTVRQSMAKVTLHMLHTCPFCWKVRGLIEYLKLDVDYVSVNGLKIKKPSRSPGTGARFPFLLMNLVNTTLTLHQS